jgi:hypothetical protein
MLLKNYLTTILIKPLLLSSIMERDIGKISKNPTTDIVIRVDDFGGRTGLTIREFVTSDKYTGFTKAGTRIPAEHFDKFKEMINSVSEEDLTNTGSSQKTLEEPKEKFKVQKPGENEDLPDY